jgi:WD40 repeat protein
LIRIEEYEYQAIVVKRVADGATLLELENAGGSGATDWKFSADGRLLVASYLGNVIRLWGLADGKQLFEIQLPGTPNGVALSPDRQWLAAGCEDKLVRVWPLSSK